MFAIRLTESMVWIVFSSLSRPLEYSWPWARIPSMEFECWTEEGDIVLVVESFILIIIIPLGILSCSDFSIEKPLIFITKNQPGI